MSLLSCISNSHINVPGSTEIVILLFFLLKIKSWKKSFAPENKWYFFPPGYICRHNAAHRNVDRDHASTCNKKRLQSSRLLLTLFSRSDSEAFGSVCQWSYLFKHLKYIFTTESAWKDILYICRVCEPEGSTQVKDYRVGQLERRKGKYW